MSRPLQFEMAGGLYHVTSRGDRREGMIAAYDTGDYTLQAIADTFKVHF